MHAMLGRNKDWLVIKGKRVGGYGNITVGTFAFIAKVIVMGVRLTQVNASEGLRLTPKESLEYIPGINKNSNTQLNTFVAYGANDLHVRSYRAGCTIFSDIAHICTVSVFFRHLGTIGRMRERHLRVQSWDVRERRGWSIKFKFWEDMLAKDHNSAVIAAHVAAEAAEAIKQCAINKENGLGHGKDGTNVRGHEGD